MKSIELLAPAKNLEYGKLAINYGADAVYIGADRFGARANAGNSVSDIAKLVKYAHKYKAKVFVTLNTILYDHELADAEKLIHQIYEAGADALIIQDMGILKMDIPPIALHASTQTNNFQLDRIQFLDDVGFERIILARELSLKEINRIKKNTRTELEFFIHGALCVSLSGQCYFSQAVTGRSANRGECAQMCRHPYNLLDANGQKIVLNSHLLSLKDLNLSKDLQGLLDAGICSLKIEGRLKDANYVKNVVSYYRQKLDEMFLLNPHFKKSSSGNTAIQFEPDAERSFNRQSTDYFISGRKMAQVNRSTPKSMGKKMGVVTHIKSGFIKVESNVEFHNGDGLCFVKKGALVGLRVEKVIEDKIFVNDISQLSKGVEIYRNLDHDFNKLLVADKSIRKIGAKINVVIRDGNFNVELSDEDGLTTVHTVSQQLEIAKNGDSAIKNIKSKLTKSGDSIFTVKEVSYNIEEAYFFRMSELNEIRRALFEQHEQHRILTFARKDAVRQIKQHAYPQVDLDFSANISNKKSAEFYKEHGVEKHEKALEVGDVRANQLLMTTRYCIKYELGFCERFQKPKNAPAEPLYLQDKNRNYLLEFDCDKCLMHIRLNE